MSLVFGLFPASAASFLEAPIWAIQLGASTRNPHPLLVLADAERAAGAEAAAAEKKASDAAALLLCALERLQKAAERGGSAAMPFLTPAPGLLLCAKAADGSHPSNDALSALRGRIVIRRSECTSCSTLRADARRVLRTGGLLVADGLDAALGVREAKRFIAWFSMAASSSPAASFSDSSSGIETAGPALLALCRLPETADGLPPAAVGLMRLAAPEADAPQAPAGLARLRIALFSDFAPERALQAGARFSALLRSGRLSAADPARQGVQPRLLIACEGEMTEPLYFRGLCKLLGLGRNLVEIGAGKGGSSPDQVYARARRAAAAASAAGNPFSEVFCVVDRDIHERFNEAVSRMRRAGFRPIVSDPAFEFWLLLHFRQTTKPYEAEGPRSRARAAIHDLKRVFPAYSKSQRDLARALYPRLGTAIENAKRVEQAAAAAGNANPSSGMWRLAERLLALSQQWGASRRLENP